MILKRYRNEGEVLSEYLGLGITILIITIPLFRHIARLTDQYLLVTLDRQMSD